MYCIKCGVELADSEKICPLCGTVVFHPELTQPEGEPLYPSSGKPSDTVSRTGMLIVLSVLLALPMAITILTDLGIGGGISWSGYAVGAILMFYVMVVLPLWFRRPNPAIFVPVDFVAVGVYLLYINCTLHGGWFLSFAFPVTGALGLITTAVVVLLRYLRRGRLYVIGGAMIALGGFTVLLEFLLNLTFGLGTGLFWSFYPLISGIVLGVAVFIVAGNRPLREALHKKLFL